MRIIHHPDFLLCALASHTILLPHLYRHYVQTAHSFLSTICDKSLTMQGKNGSAPYSATCCVH